MRDYRGKGQMAGNETTYCDVRQRLIRARLPGNNGTDVPYYSSVCHPLHFAQAQTCFLSIHEPVQAFK